MNETTGNTDINDILIYIQLAEITISMIGTLFLNWKLGHLRLDIGKCCCIEDLHIDIESDSERSAEQR